MAQLIASLYTVITFNSARDAFHLACQDIVFTLIAEAAFYYKNYKDYKMKINYTNLPESRPLQEDDNDSDIDFDDDQDEDKAKDTPKEEEDDGEERLDDPEQPGEEAESKQVRE